MKGRARLGEGTGRAGIWGASSAEVRGQMGFGGPARLGKGTGRAGVMVGKQSWGSGTQAGLGWGCRQGWVEQAGLW